jgi:hypothetical protein
MLALLSVGCSLHAPGNNDAEKVLGFSVNPRSYRVIDASIRVPLSAVSSIPPTFYMKTDHGVTTEWKSKRVTPSGDQATILLVPRGNKNGPSAGDTVLIYYRTPTGVLTLLPEATIPAAPPAPSILNSDFSVWNNPIAPDDWSLAASSRASFDLRRFGMQPYGVRVSIATDPQQQPGAIVQAAPGSVPTVALSQSVQKLRSPLHARVRPFEPCVILKGRLVAATGIELSAGSGSSTLICIGSGALSKWAQLDGRRIMIKTVKGRIGSWNVLDLDLRGMARALGRAPYDVAVFAEVDAYRSPYDWVAIDVAQVRLGR